MDLTANIVDTATACGIVFLRPYDVRNSCPSNSHPGKTLHADGKYDLKYDEQNNGWFSGKEYRVNGIRSLFSVVVQHAEEALTFAIMGALRSPGARFCSRRKSLGDGRRLPGITPTERRWVALDIDGLPNPAGHDPRKDPQATASWIRSLLPGDFALGTVGVSWSSSCCARTPTGVAPRTLSCRIWLWLSAPLGERDARRLMYAIRAEVTSQLAADGIECPPRVVDPSLSTANQPNYIAKPRFAGGLVDPLPARHLLLEGDIEEVDPGPLLVPTLASQAASVRRFRADRKTVIQQTKPSMPVIPLAAATRLLAARREADAQRGKSGDGYRAACLGLYLRRWPPELVSLVLWRRGRAEAGDARYAEWLHGVPEGMRNAYAVMLSSGVVAALPTGLGEVRVRDEIRSLLRLIVPADWLSAEWEGSADKSVIGRYLAAPELGQATLAGPRYTYSKATLVEAIEVTEEEVGELGLRSLASDAVRLRANRAGDSAIRRAERGARDAEVIRLSLAGMSIREAADRAGVSKSTVGRILASYAKAAWDRAVAAQRAAQESRRSVRTAPEPAEADTLTLEREAAVAWARRALENLARVSGLSVAELRRHVREWLVDQGRAPHKRAA